MATVIRPELAKGNKYYISRHRYYELKHFCLQYPEWKEQYHNLGDTRKSVELVADKVDTISSWDEVAEVAEEMMILSEKMEMIEHTALEADRDIGDYIFKAVTENLTFPYLQGVLKIPCGKDMFYDRYHKFFWLLDKER